MSNEFRRYTVDTYHPVARICECHADARTAWRWAWRMARLLQWRAVIYDNRAFRRYDVTPAGVAA